MKIVYTKAD